MERKRFTVITLPLLLGLVLLENTMPRTNAFLSGDNFVEEITSASGKAELVDVDSEGRIFLNDGNNDIWCSTDSGSTWTKVLDGNDYAMSVPLILFVDSRDYIFASWIDGGIWRLVRSINHGISWTTVSSDCGYGRRMAESPSGNLYVVRYYATDNVWNSTDNGATWQLFKNETGVSHGHDIGVAPNGYVFVSFGDYPTCKIYRWNTTTWQLLSSGSVIDQSTAFTFVDNDMIMYPDAVSSIYRMPVTGNYAEKQVVWFSNVYVTSAYVFDAQYYDDGITLFGTKFGQLWGSWDGYHWVKVWEDTAVDIRSFSNQRPIYFQDRNNHKLWKVNIQKEDLIKLYYSAISATGRHLKTNADSYVLEQRITNGTNYVDLTSVALSNVQASIKGLDNVNEMLTASHGNTGFEWSNATGWTISANTTTYGNHWFATEEKANGTYSIKIRKNDAATSVKYVSMSAGQAIIAKKSAGDIIVLSLYAKANVSVSGTPLLLQIVSNGTSVARSYALTSSWSRYSCAYYLGRTYAETQSIYVQIGLSRVVGTNYDVYVDSVLFQRYSEGFVLASSATEEEVFYTNGGSGGSTDGIYNGLSMLYQPYHSAVNSTINPSLTVNSQSVSHSGTLTNGTEPSITSLTGIFTGAVQVSANIQGSGQTILRITGKRILYEDSIILKARRDNVYYGRYYNMFSPKTTTRDLIAVTNLQANITSLTSTINMLTLTTDSFSGTTSSIKVYVGDRGQPKDVSGATSWNYDSASKVLTINALHSSTIQITVQWRFVGDLNGDGIVDATDLSIFNEAFGSTGGPPPSADWDPNCNCNGDNKIDVSDLFSLGKNYGKIDP